jgi:hypothetical protein
MALRGSTGDSGQLWGAHRVILWGGKKCRLRRLLFFFRGMSKCTVNQHSGEIKIKRRVRLHGLSPHPDYKGGGFLNGTTTNIRELVMFFGHFFGRNARAEPIFFSKEKNMLSDTSTLFSEVEGQNLVAVPSLGIIPPPQNSFEGVQNLPAHPIAAAIAFLYAAIYRLTRL